MTRIKPDHFAQLERIAARYAEMMRKFGNIDCDAEEETRQIARTKLFIWNSREPLNLDVLEKFNDVNFAHDMGGVMRDDFLLSARSALAYHPIQPND